MKENVDFFAEHICRQFNETICSSKFPATFKFANVTPVFKKGNQNQKDNYRPISILPIISKIFEKLICRQLSNHFDNIFSKFQCGFRKGFSAQHCLLLMIDKCKKAVDSNKVFLTGLSKAFDCICHDLLVDSGLPSESKTKNKSWIFLQFMGEYYIWCSTGFHFRTSLI